MAEFHRGPYETACEQSELITEVRLPIRVKGGRNAGSTFVDNATNFQDWA